MSGLVEKAEKLRAAVANQGMKVRTLKKDGAQKPVLDQEISALQKLKAELTEAEKAIEDSKPLYTRCREQLGSLLTRRFFIAPSFEIYGGVAGLYDFGPPGCALKAEVEALWRQHFVLTENMLEVSGTCMTPEPVLKTSGHVDRFTDLMVKDEKTGECFRADKYLEDFIQKRIKENAPPLSPSEKNELELLERQADGLGVDGMAEAFAKLSIKSPSGNEFTKPFPFNLMFKTSIGPQGNVTGYLRPETAQGIFVNFRRLLEYNGGRMPFAAAQLGLGFRNEIAPRNGLLRVREFQMGEIEHFVHPNHKDHPKFDNVKHLKLPLYPRERQMTDGRVVNDMTIEEAVAKKVINNQTLAYFLARTFLFLTKCGVQNTGLRFRQHLATEMAHYACDCWDAEIETSYGWVECVGHADRSAYDLSHHSEASKTELVAHYKYDEPVDVDYVKFTPDKKKLGPLLKKDQETVLKVLEACTDDEKMAIQAELEEKGSYTLTICNGQSWTLTKDLIKFERATKKLSEESFVPAVIEPSFGIGRILYSILEHTFRSRGIEEQEERCFLALPPCIAPTKVSILPISAQPKFEPLIQQIREAMVLKSVSSVVDASTAAIGRRYARTDEIGVPFGITVDFESLENNTVTLRERDSMTQVRLSAAEVAGVVADLVAGRTSWKQVTTKFPKFTEQAVKN